MIPVPLRTNVQIMGRHSTTASINGRVAEMSVVHGVVSRVSQVCLDCVRVCVRRRWQFGVEMRPCMWRVHAHARRSRTHDVLYADAVPCCRKFLIPCRVCVSARVSHSVGWPFAWGRAAAPFASRGAPESKINLRTSSWELHPLSLACSGASYSFASSFCGVHSRTCREKEPAGHNQWR